MRLRVRRQMCGSGESMNAGQIAGALFIQSQKLMQDAEHGSPNQIAAAVLNGMSCAFHEIAAEESRRDAEFCEVIAKLSRGFSKDCYDEGRQ